MTRLEQRGAPAFAVVIFIALVIVEDDDAPLARLLGQPKLLHLSAHLVHVPAKELAVSAIVRPWSSSFLRSLISASDQGSPEFASIGITPNRTTECGRGFRAQAGRSGPGLRALPSCAPINRDHAREHERKSEFCFEVGNESRNPPGRGHVPIKCWRVACTQVAKKPNRKSGCVNRPADALGIWHPTPRRSSSAVATSQEDHHSPGINETLT